jgi:flavin reductase (DIM6/NTAB) family NADH-FMN oxidoreductase RutF
MGTTDLAIEADRMEFCALMSSFPTGVTVVTAMTADGVPRGLTCTAMASVSVDPPMLLACLSNRSGTLAAIGESMSFAVNILHAGGRGTAELFASQTADRFGLVAWRLSSMVAAPLLIEDALALAECQVDRMVPAGDHTVVIGRVVRVSNTAQAPLMYGRRRFSVWNDLPVHEAALRS